MRAIRSAGRMAEDLGAYVLRSGRWWLPVVIILTVVAVLTAAAAKTVVPTAVYTLF